MIGVKLGDRKIANGTQVVSWDADTAPDATVKFVSADADRPYRFKAQSDGLYCYPTLGLMVIIQ